MDCNIYIEELINHECLRAAIGTAMSVLNDPEKRKHYDLYGPDDMAHSGRSTRAHHDHRTGFEGQSSLTVLIFKGR